MPEGQSETGFKGKIKHLMMRVMRPGLMPVSRRVDEVYRAVGTLGESVGRLNEIDADHKKYDSELEYWRWLVKNGGAERGFGAPFVQVFGRWTRDRMIKMGEWLGLEAVGQDGSIDDWASGRSVIEIGAGPYPLVASALKGWKRCVAVDPIARGYVEEGLLPAAADRVVYVAARGESIPLPTGSADLVVIENCLDHVRDPAAVLREITRLLTPGGHLWLFVDLSNHVDHMHPHAMNEKKVRELLREFNIVRDEVTEHKAHPEAYGSYCGLLMKPVRVVRENAGTENGSIAHDVRGGGLNGSGAKDVGGVVEVRDGLLPGNVGSGSAAGRPRN